MTNHINIKKIRDQAENLYESGSFNCCESVVAAVKDQMGLEYDNNIIKLATGFGGGLGAGATCGALCGGVISLGMVFGRDIPKDPKAAHAKDISKELLEYFKSEKEHIDCSLLSKGYIHGTPEHKAFCKDFVGMIAQKTVEIIAREKQLTAE